MKYKWQKLGLLYCLPKNGLHPKLKSHAANPLAILIEGNLYRIFFSGRDENNRSAVGAVDVDIVERKVVSEYNYPFFENGPANSFYSHGVSIGNSYVHGRSRYILFMGWQCPAGQHWRGDIGRLIVRSDLTLELDSKTPFITTDEIDPISLSYPWVMQEEDGVYHMWYGSTRSWDAGNAEMLHVINHATSRDGEYWIKHGLSVPYQLGVAQAYSHPTVVKDDDGFHMWFSYRSGTGKKYRIGYAVSPTGRKWELKLDDVGIDVSAKGWDSEMIEYPFVFDHKNQKYMLYNGNAHGLSGFGLAVQEPP